MVVKEDHSSATIQIDTLLYLIKKSPADPREGIAKSKENVNLDKKIDQVNLETGPKF